MGFRSSQYLANTPSGRVLVVRMDGEVSIETFKKGDINRGTFTNDVVENPIIGWDYLPDTDEDEFTELKASWLEDFWKAYRHSAAEA
jgi:hypothetical protein